MTYNPYTHHRRSIRLPNYDYTRGGIYFLTLCSLNRECVFGNIINGRVKLNLYGIIVEHFWEKINDKYDSVHTDEMIIMPNHIHGIIILKKNSIIKRDAVTPPLHSLGKIMAWYKYVSTKYINRIRQSPGSKIWQRNYYDRIIRNKKEYDRIVKYIRKNPSGWESDMNNPNNI